MVRTVLIFFLRSLEIKPWVVRVEAWGREDAPLDPLRLGQRRDPKRDGHRGARIHEEGLLEPLHEARVPPRGPPGSCLFVHFPLIWISRFIFELYGCRQIWIISFNPNMLTLF